jgi:NTP pyrophosphatase (non-canonical NTP hydrolase)
MPDEIQRRALETWYEADHPLHSEKLHPAIGLAGEVGELLNLMKKHLFKPGYQADDLNFLDELGDCLYYLAILAHQFGATLDELSLLNYHKLTERENDGIGYNRGIGPVARGISDHLDEVERLRNSA